MSPAHNARVRRAITRAVATLEAPAPIEVILARARCGSKGCARAVLADLVDFGLVRVAGKRGARLLYAPVSPL